MFYSHFVLARKGPLGTVWMAAHLQHKLRKSQVTETNISTSVDSIMFPEVPIALRLSGHLLLGVVRIYSKKVDYLYHDCNETLTKLRYAFASIEIDLPEEASTAPVHTITIPETLELDAFQVDQVIYGFAEAQDNHIRTHEDITIPDQVPGEEEQYATFNLDEECSFGRTLEPVVPGFGPSYMDVDSYPHLPVAGDVHVNGPTTTVNIDKHNQEDIVMENIETEIMRDAVNVSGLGQVIDEFQERDKTIEEPCVPVDRLVEDHNLCFIPEEIPTPVAPLSTHSCQSLHVLVSPEASKERDKNSAFVLLPTPPGQKPAAKSRKRKQHFDEVIVLSNTLMKKQLDDTRKLKRKRRRAPCSTVRVLWPRRNSHQEEIFQEPLISGMSTKLQDLLKKKHFAPKLGLPSREVTFECREAEPPASTPLTELEIEQLRCEAGYSNDAVADILPSKILTPSTAVTLESAIDMEYDFETGFDAEREVPASAEPVVPGVDASVVDDAHQLTPEETPEFGFRRPFEKQRSEPLLLQDLDCLEADSSQTGTTQDGVESWSVRTRAVAQYLKKSFKSPLDSSNKLNLSNILEGRTRKDCSRMFFEVLVLKSRGCIEVYQEQPYDDITISMAPGLTNVNL